MTSQLKKDFASQGLMTDGSCQYGNVEIASKILGVSESCLDAEPPPQGVTFPPRITLRPRDIVIMDNLPAHKVDGVRQAIEAAGASLRYLPPTAPTSIPSKWPSPSSRPRCAPPKREPSPIFGKPSPTPFAASPRKNAPTISPPLDTMQRERKMP
jgi:hypothetical protein